MIDAVLLNQILVATGMGLVGAIVFAAIGLVSGTDETTTLAPLTLLVVLLGVPPEGVFTFFLAAAVAKHMTHAVPTALLGIPGDTMATPLLQDANVLRNLGVPHIALRKMVSGASEKVRTLSRFMRARAAGEITENRSATNGPIAMPRK